MRYSTVGRLRKAGFALPEMPGEMCLCGHPSDDHILAATLGSPVDGGIISCQLYPEDCRCSTTWSVKMPEDMKEKFRGRE